MSYTGVCSQMKNLANSVSTPRINFPHEIYSLRLYSPCQIREYISRLRKITNQRRNIPPLFFAYTVAKFYLTQTQMNTFANVIQVVFNGNSLIEWMKTSHCNRGSDWPVQHISESRDLHHVMAQTGPWQNGSEENQNESHIETSSQ